MARFPIELVEKIIAALVIPSHRFQYGPLSDAMDALRELCLVSRVVRHITMPLLYSQVTVKNLRQYDAFIRTLHGNFSLTTYTRVLWIESFPNAIYFIHNLLYLLGPHLRQLTFAGISKTELDSSYLVCDALRQHCTNLEDYAHVQCPTANYIKPTYAYPSYGISWSFWEKLNRLVLDDVYIDDYFIRKIRKMFHLSHLTLINPRWPGLPKRPNPRWPITNTIPNLLRDLGRSLQGVHIIFLGVAGIISSSVFVVDRMAHLTGAFESLEEEEIPGAKIIAIMGDTELATMEYTLDSIYSGEIWDLTSGFVEIEENEINICAL